jgi:4-amino-4-deoxy-L-arabinose transferase-like glycosyltransferase
VIIFKRLRSNPYQSWMIATVAVATLLRLVLIALLWPATDSDEGNMGLLALHVTFRGEHPIFFYGAPYLAPLEGYAAAPLFRLFGVSLFTLRLPLVLCFAGFLVSMYYLVRLLYRSEKYALASIILLSMGSPDVLFLQLRASGEYPEIEFFAALMCLLAVWLALTLSATGQQVSRRERWKRVIIYGVLGLIVGLALWDDLLILPFVVGVVLLLVLFCRRELLGWPAVSFVVGVVVGAFPMIYYNVTAPFSQNSWFVLQKLDQSGANVMAALHLTWVNQLSGTLFVALPMATGGGMYCPLSAIPPAGGPSAATLPCLLFQGSWGTGYLVLWIIAAALAIVAIWRYVLRASIDREEVIRQSGRLLLLVSVGLTLLVYALSPSPATVPDTSFRYLACLLLAIPVLLWPVWKGVRMEDISKQAARRKVEVLLRVGILLLVVVTFASGIVRTYLQVPATQAAYQREEAVVQDLLHIGATRVYSDYWTCNVLTFLSKEKVICSVLDIYLNPGYDRYLPYRSIVRAAPHPAYIFLAGTQEAEEIEHQVVNKHYHYYTFEGYVVYQMT